MLKLSDWPLKHAVHGKKSWNVGSRERCVNVIDVLAVIDSVCAPLRGAFKVPPH